LSGRAKEKNVATEKWKKRVAQVMLEELGEPEKWHYVSFADTSFREVVIIKAHGVTDAITKCHTLGINPGGQVMCVPMPDEVINQVSESHRNRLLSKEDVQSIWPDAKTIREHEEEVASAMTINNPDQFGNVRVKSEDCGGPELIALASYVAVLEARIEELKAAKRVDYDDVINGRNFLPAYFTDRIGALEAQLQQIRKG
jgi:hypothetical protein